MRCLFLLAAFLLVWCPCGGRPADEESVVSVYTTLPSTGGGQLDVYRQIAGNIADRVAQPFYRLFGLANSTQAPTTTKRPFEHIELAPDKPTLNQTPERDVEEISIESSHKSDKKPEKFTLFSSYLPVKSNLELNETNDDPKTNDVATTNDESKTNNDPKTTDIDTNDIDSDENSLELDDVDDGNNGDSGRGGPFVYLLELIGSVIQLLWGGFVAIFNPSTESERR